MSADTWNGHVDDSWRDLDNWSSGVPAADDDVTVPEAKDDAQLDDFYGSIKSLTIDDGAEVDLQGQTDLVVLQNVMNDGLLTVNELPAIFDSTLSVDGTLTNNGTIYVGESGSGPDDQLDANQLDNAGYLYLNGTSSVEAIVDISSAAGTGTAGTLTGTIDLAGYALLEFADDQIVTNNAYLVLAGPDAFVADAGQTNANSALSGLTSNTRRLDLDDASLSTDGDFANSGILALDRKTGGASFSVKGALTNSNAVEVGNSALTAADQLAAASFDNLSGGALDIQGSATKHATVKVGFAAPGGGGVTNAGQIELDANASDGGSSLQIDGALVNDDSLQIGNIALAASDLVSADSVVNAGAITLIGKGAAQAKLSATSMMENGGGLTVGSGSAVTTGSFQQDAAGDVSLQVAGASNYAEIAATGGVALDGGGLQAPTSGYAFAADETFDLITFARDQLVGMFDDISIGGVSGDGASVDLGGGLLAGLEYDDSAGAIALKIAATPSSNNDVWIAGSANWSDADDWSNNAPDFYSAVSISTGAATTVTLTSDKTIDSLQIGAADALTTNAGTDLSIGAGAHVAGTLDIGGEAFIDGAVTDGGAIAVSGALLDVRGPVSGAGTLAIGAGSELELGSSDSADITFDGAGATLKLDQASAFSGKLDDMKVGDVIDLANVKYTGGAPQATGDPLSVTEGGTTYTFDFMQNVGADAFAASADASGAGTEIVLDAACYCRGARIATPGGEVAIERLREGDLVMTASGEARPVRWIGRRAIDIARHPRPQTVAPVRIAADAFGEGLPRRDLWVSPGHNIAMLGALAPAFALINQLSVEQVAVDRVEYWHVELDAHDVLLAEGLPAESYLDTGNRRAFVNGGAFVDAFPDFQPKHWAQTCLPLVADGPKLAEIKTLLFDRLQARGYAIVEESDAHLVVDGKRYEPDWPSPLQMLFVLPDGCQSLVLKSRVFVPAHSLAESQDTRSLGLCVRSLTMDGEPLALTQDAGAGWRPPEVLEGGFCQRWTDGAATLPAGAREIIVDLAGPGYYWRAPVCSRGLQTAASP